MNTSIRVVALVCALLLSIAAQSHTSLAAGTGASAADAIEFGQAATVGDYEFTVTGIDDNAKETILETDDSNAEPPAGYAYFMASIDATNIGTEASGPAFSFTFQVVGPSARGLTSHYFDCGTIPNDGFEIESVNPGDSVTFNVCWVVPEQDLGALVMYVDPLLSSGEDIVWFSLGNDAPTFAAPVIPEGLVTANTEADPAAMGVTGQTGPYLITVTGTNPDATDQILEMDSFNEGPADGYRFVLINVSVTYIGDGVGDPGVELSYDGVGQSGTEYSTAADSCGIVTNDEFSTGDLFTGAVVTYNVCWQVAADDADSLLLQVASYGDGSGETVWFSLQG
jgi:hypothetical protein